MLLVTAANSKCALPAAAAADAMHSLAAHTHFAQTNFSSPWLT